MYQSKHKNLGFSLIEILVAMLVSAIGIVGLMALQAQTLRATQDTNNYSQAIWVFNDIVNRIKINRITPSFYLTENFNCAQPAEKICSTYHSGQAKVPAVDCTTEEAANFDLWSLICGTPKPENAFNSSSDFLVNPQLTIECLNASCIDIASPMVITLSWNSRTDDSQQLTISEVIHP